MPRLGDLLSKVWIEDTVDDGRHRVGDLIFSRTGFSGVVLDTYYDRNGVLDEDVYVVVWTVPIPTTHGGWWFNEQLRKYSTLRKKG